MKERPIIREEVDRMLDKMEAIVWRAEAPAWPLLPRGSLGGLACGWGSPCGGTGIEATLRYFVGPNAQTTTAALREAYKREAAGKSQLDQPTDQATESAEVVADSSSEQQGSR